MEKKIGEAQKKFEESDLSQLKQDVAKLKSLESKIDGIEENIGKIWRYIEKLNKKFSVPVNVSSPPDNDGEIKELRKELSKLQKQSEAVSNKEVAPPKESILSAIVEMEKGMLESRWNSFKKEYGEVVDLANRTKESGEISFYSEVLSQRLLALLDADPDDEQLVSSYSDIVLQLKEYYPQMINLPIIDRYAAGDLETKEWGDQKELSNLRNWSQLLTSLQNPREVKRLLDFKLEKWIGGEFLEIADKVLLRYHETKIEKRSGNLQELYDTVLEVLEKGNLKPVEIILKKTVFDSTKHTARSTISDTTWHNGVIVGIQRNGFELDGRVIQKPQVIVNKV